MSQQLSLFFFGLFLFSSAYAQNLQWNTPEVIPEKLMRDNRRVLRFSGTANPGTQIRVRDNKVKMIFNRNKIRWARLPQKHRVQFPVIASETGYFSFELYLPITPVEVPLELFKGGKWVPYRFSFEVPKSGQAEDFKFVEESFKTRKDEDDTKVEDFLSEYDKNWDQGQVVNDRGDWKGWVTGKIMLWGSLGFNYYSLDESISSNPPSTLSAMSGMGFPAWEVGGEYRWNPQWIAEISYINRANKGKEDGGFTLQNESFNWTELRANVGYFPEQFEKEAYRIGAVGGLHFHDVPYVQRVGGPQVHRIFTNSIVFAAIGARLETMKAHAWNYDLTAMLMYPIVVDKAIDVDSAYGMNLTFTLIKEIIPALYMGGKVDAHYLMMEASHNDTSVGPPNPTATSDISLWQLTPSFILKAEF